jgi:hypothetical protein
MRTRLTAAQIWMILTPPRASDADMTAMVGAKVSSVHNARWSLARTGWTCGVRYEPCHHCGDLATLRGSSPRHAYHALYRSLAQAKKQRRLDAERQVCPEQIARIQAWSNATQERTRRDTVNTGTRWIEDEDAIGLELMGRPSVETCDDLRRSKAAVAYRKVRRRCSLVANEETVSGAPATIGNPFAEVRD